jgi:phosphoserine aminotransferase
MAIDRVYNFSAGPSMLPLEVLEKAGSEITNFQGCGMSVMEMSHRSKAFIDIYEETKSNMKELLKVPDNYSILFLQGGGSLQFAMVPMNLMTTGKADYAVTGNFATIAHKEGKKYGICNVAASSEDKNHTYIPSQSELKLDNEASYFYYCDNNTIYGTEWKYIPETGSVPLVTDMSSNILTKPVDVSKYGIIFAGAQKNMGPAGATLVIIRNDLVGQEKPYTPIMMSYKEMVSKDSMYNTPPCFSIYALGLTLKWVKQNGGIDGMSKLKIERSNVLYNYLEESKLFSSPVRFEDRSFMNIPFVTGSEELDKKFVKEAEASGLVNIAGHRSVGGMRASIYNAMPIEGVKKLVEFMKAFELKNK